MITFSEVLREIPQAEMIRIARDARPPADYLWSTILPERPRPTYTVEAGSMTIKTTMAGMVGMDSAYPPGGAIQVSSFYEQTAKFAINVPMGERTLREIQEWARVQDQSSSQARAQMVETALNFYNAVILQSHLDRAEWIRGQVLTTGAISWTYNGITLAVDYGLPADNRLTERTVGNGDAYHLAGSKFWEDVRAARSLLRDSARIVAIAHPDTVDAIISNDDNSLLVADEINGVFSLQRYKSLAGNTVASPDARDRIQLIQYGNGGEILDLSAGNTGATTAVPFCPPGKIVFVGSGVNRGFTFDPMSRRDPDNDLEIGYYHVGPTVEGNNQPGRWGRVYTPEGAQYKLHGEAVENSLPVLENPSRLVIATTEMAA